MRILCVGKIKEDYLKKLINDYLFRINKYIKLEITELKDNPIYEKEIQSIINNLKETDYNIALDLRGKEYTSIEFSKKLEDTLIQNSNITFIIGGSNGLNDEVLSKCDEVISFSHLTFPHGLFRGILLEQIYRSMKIINNEKYHK